MLTIQKYVRAKSLEEAWELNQQKNNRILGGMLWMRLSSSSVNTAIDLCELHLDTIEENEEAFVIGASVPLRDLEQHEGLQAYTRGAVKEALKGIVGVQFRNTATIGGSLWGRFGFSDVLTVFLALDSCVELYRGGIVPLEEFVKMKQDNDILVRLIVKKTPGRIVYQSMRNQRTDFPVITCCVSRLGPAYRAVVGARPQRAMAVYDANHLLEGEITPEKAEAFADFVAKQVPTGSNTRAGAAYRSHLIRVLTARALHTLTED